MQRNRCVGHTGELEDLGLVSTMGRVCVCVCVGGCVCVCVYVCVEIGRASCRERVSLCV
jgi:hypothetical protein